MFTKHFFKTLFLFTVMIGIALLGIYWVSNLGEEEPKAANTAKTLAE